VTLDGRMLYFTSAATIRRILELIPIGATVAQAVYSLTTGRTIGVRSPAGAENFFLVSVSRPALGRTQPPIQWVPGVLSPGVKRGRGVTLATHPHLVPRLSMSRSYTSSPPHVPPWHVAGQLYFFLYATKKFVVRSTANIFHCCFKLKEMVNKGGRKEGRR
jgi:hypothetical protein